MLDLTDLLRSRSYVQPYAADEMPYIPGPKFRIFDALGCFTGIACVTESTADAIVRMLNETPINTYTFRASDWTRTVDRLKRMHKFDNGQCLQRTGEGGV